MAVIVLKNQIILTNMLKSKRMQNFSDIFDSVELKVATRLGGTSSVPLLRSI